MIARAMSSGRMRRGDCIILGVNWGYAHILAEAGLCAAHGIPLLHFDADCDRRGYPFPRH